MSLCVLIFTVRMAMGFRTHHMAALNSLKLDAVLTAGVIKMQAETSKGTWCGNTIPQAKLVEIEGRIRAEEKRKLAEAEASFKKQYEEEARLQIERETKKVAERERKAAEQWAKAQTSKLQAERDNALEKAKALAAKQAALKKKMAEDAELAIKKAVEAERKVAAERAREQTRKLQTVRDGAMKKAQTLEEQQLTL